MRTVDVILGQLDKLSPIERRRVLDALERRTERTDRRRTTGRVGRAARRRRPTEDFFAIAGTMPSRDGETDVSRNKHRYLAEALSQHKRGH